MKYKAKRFRAGLSTYTVAKELGVDWNKYLDVERGKVALEGEYINKFQNVLKNAKMIKFNRRQRLEDIKNFIKDGKLSDLMAKRGYNGMSLARAMGLDANVIKEVMDGTNQSDDTNEYVYDFLQDPFNINADGVEKEEAENKRYETNDDKKIKVEELRKLKEEKGFTCQEISNAIGIAGSTISHTLNGRKTKEKTLQKIYNFLLNNEKKLDNTSELENILVQKKLSKMDVARALGINYSYVYNFLKGMNVNKKYQKMITDYIMNAEGKGKKVSIELTENFEDEKIISTATLDKMLAEETTSEDVIETGILCCEEEDEDEEELVDIEDLITEGLIEEEVQTQSDKDYFELLKENADLKEKLAQAQKQVSRYEILVDIIGGLKNDNQCRPSR